MRGTADARGKSERSKRLIAASVEILAEISPADGTRRLLPVVQPEADHQHGEERDRTVSAGNSLTHGSGGHPCVGSGRDP